MSIEIGVDVGGTNLRVGAVEGVNIIDEYRCAADFSQLCHTHPADEAYRRILDVIAAALQTMLQRFPATRAIGIGFPGFIDPASGRISQSPNMPGLADVDLAGALTQRLQRPVAVHNDALAAAFGEHQRMAQPVADLIYLGLGTGVGGGLILNHRPFPGQHGVAMEIGHLITQPQGRLCGCGNRGCLEQYASASGVAISYRQHGGEQLTAEAIAARAQAGDEAACAAFTLAAETLAQGLAHILKVLDVTTVVIGGGMSRAWPLMAPRFWQRLDEALIPALRQRVALTISSSHDQAGIIGAARLAAVG